MEDQFLDTVSLCGEDATLEGRLCTCLEYGRNTHYSFWKKACVPKPEKYDGLNNITYNLEIPYMGDEVSRRILLNLDICTEIEGYRTTNFRLCVLDCSRYADEGEEVGRYENSFTDAGKGVCKCSENPKSYMLALTTSENGPWRCVSFDECTNDGFVDISDTRCLPLEDSDKECSGSLLGDEVDGYRSFRRLVDGRC